MGAIDRMIEEQHLLMHRFYQHWQKGKVTPEVLRSYAVQYYAYESALPKFLEQAMAHLPEGPALESLKDNLADEAGGAVTHPELWLRFAEALGVSRQEVQEAFKAKPLRVDEIDKGLKELFDDLGAAIRARDAHRVAGRFDPERMFDELAAQKVVPDGLLGEVAVLRLEGE